MADEYRYLDPGATTLTNLLGTVEDTHEDPTVTQTNWLTADDPGSATAVDGTFNPPSTTLSGTQEFGVRARSTNNGNGGAEITITLDDGSTPVLDVGLAAGETRVFDAADGLSLSAADIADANAVDLVVDGASGGGMVGSRDTIEVGAVRWAVALDQYVDVETLDPTGVTTGEARLRGDLQFSSYNSVDVWFDYREVGASTWSQTTTQQDVAPGEFDHLLTGLASDTEYEYRAQADADNGTDTATGAIVSFWTTLEIAGVVTAGGSAVDGATVYIVDVAAEAVAGTTTTNATGEYAIELPGGNTYHVAGQHDDGTTTYAGESFPYIGGGS